MRANYSKNVKYDVIKVSLYKEQECGVPSLKKTLNSSKNEILGTWIVSGIIKRWSLINSYVKLIIRSIIQAYFESQNWLKFNSQLYFNLWYQAVSQFS